jgi:hypothetical protein
MIYLFVLFQLLIIVFLVLWSAVDDLILADEYKCPSDGPDMVSTGQGLENWRIGKAEAVRIEGKV